jgi:hypothetical protein
MGSSLGEFQKYSVTQLCDMNERRRRFLFFGEMSSFQSWCRDENAVDQRDFSASPAQSSQNFNFESCPARKAA